MLGVALVATLVAGLMVPAAGTARAQYPIEAPGDCASTFDADGQQTTTFVLGESIRVVGEAGCARPNEPNVRGALEPVGHFLFRTDARGDGSYDSGLVSLPSRIAPGDYRVVVRTADNTYVQPIRITIGVVPDVLERLRDLLRRLQQRLDLLLGRLELDTGSSEAGSAGVEEGPARLGTLRTRLTFSGRRHSQADGPTGAGSPSATLTDRRPDGASASGDSLQTPPEPLRVFVGASPFSP